MEEQNINPQGPEQQPKQIDPSPNPRDHQGNPSGWLFGLAAAVLVAVLGGIGYANMSRDRAQLKSQVTELTNTNQVLHASLDQVKTQVQSIVDKANEEAQARAKAAATVNAASSSAQRQSGTARRVAIPVVDPRIARLQGQLADQSKQLDSTREDLSKTREELQGKIDSTRDDLNGSIASTRDDLSGNIARSHDEIVALQKRGERNYYEFQLPKTKEFKRVGPVSVSLRKANTKRKSYDLAMIIDDIQLQKKSINLFEPVWINLQDRPQPVELVVNQITKDQIQGYISEPKYKRSELGESATAATSTQPALAAR